MAKMIPDIPLTVITNSVNVVMELSKKSNIIVISTGGKLMSKSLSYVGPLAEEAINKYYVDKLFIPVRALICKMELANLQKNKLV